MRQAYELGPVGEGDRFRVALLTAAFSAVLGIGIAYVLLMTQPDFSQAARNFLGERLFPDAAQWVIPVAIAGVATGIAGVGIYVLSGFVRGARRQPFLLLAPLLCGLSVTVLAGMPAEPALGTFGSPGFAVPALMLALGGATLFQLRGAAAKVSGVVAWLAPGVLLVLGYLSQPVRTDLAALLSPQSHPFSLLLSFSWASLGLIALLAPDAADSVPVAQAQAVLGKLRRRLTDAEARAHMASTLAGGGSRELMGLQARLQQAEAQIQQAAGLYEALGEARARADRLEADAIAGRIQRPSLLWLVGVGVGGFLLAGIIGYWAVLRPLQGRLSAVVTQANSTLGAQEEAALERASLLAAQQEAATALSTERAKLKEANTALESQKAALADLRARLEAGSQATSATAAPGPQPKGRGNAKKAQARRGKPRVASIAPSARTSGPVKASAKARTKKAASKAPAAAAKRAAPKKSSVRDDLSGFMSDDPIGGL